MALEEDSHHLCVKPLTMADLRLCRGAKTAMALALQSPHSVADIVAVDNAPVDALLGSDFSSYIRGMKKVDQSHVTKLAEADKILQEVEKVRRLLDHSLDHLTLTRWLAVPSDSTISSGKSSSRAWSKDTDIQNTSRYTWRCTGPPWRFSL